MRIVRLRPSGRQFYVLEGETVLQAALRQNIDLPHGCKNGICGFCKAHLAAGTVNRSARAHVGEDILLCCARPQTDLLIDEAIEPAVSRRFQCEVISMQRACDDVMLLELQVRHDALFDFIPGQYIDFALDDGSKRSFSIANVPCPTNRIQLHVRNVAGGKFTRHIFEETAPGNTFWFEGPRGDFRLKAGTDKPIVFVASGTGFAPIKSMLESMIASNVQRRATLYWGARKPADLYMHDLAKHWSRLLRCFSYAPVISERVRRDGWQGRVGLVHEAVIRDLPNLSGHEVYACGNPATVAAARDAFAEQCRLAPDQFHADPFTTRHDDVPPLQPLS
jgi:CDP-4-dehydro-6-deoxyglucose reductase